MNQALLQGPQVVAVLGPTASGKSDLGLLLAERLHGEIICCDSMQVYRGLDIGTGKPTAHEQARVRHHLLDVADPNQSFHAGAWAKQARLAVEDIVARGRLPVIVGGTGLYFRALTRGLFDAPPPSAEIRAQHKAEADSVGVPVLHARLAQIDPQAAAKISPTDLVRTSRALEVWQQTGVPITELWRRAQPAQPLQCYSIVFDRPLPQLRQLIDNRVEAMMAAGFLQEVQHLREAGYAQARALLGLGYKELSQHLDGRCDLPTAVSEIKHNTAGYARRQRTWFRSETTNLAIAATPEVDQVLEAVGAWLGGGQSTSPM